MRNSNVLTGTIFIIIGLVFLLDNFAIIDWRILIDLLHFWPILLIIFGLNLIFGKTRLFFVAPLLLILLIVLVVFYPSVLPGRIGPSREMVLSQDLELGIRQAKIRMNLFAADIDVYNLKPEERGLLFSGEVTYSQVPPELSYKINGYEAVVDIASEKKGSFFGIGSFRSSDSRMSLGLTELIPLRLDIKSGASDLDLDLSLLRVEALDLEAGASSIEIKFGDISEKLVGTIKGGVSKVLLIIPKWVGTRIKLDSGLASNNLKEVGFKKDGNVYTSPNYSTSNRVIDIDVAIGVGNLDVRFID